MSPDIQNGLVRIIIAILVAQWAGGMLWVLLWVWERALYQFTRTVENTGAFMEFCFYNVGKRWWGRWR